MGTSTAGRATYFVNGYFRSQPVTGQQRFATEIADRLPRLLPSLAELRPTSRQRSSRGREWLELQAKVPRTVGEGTLVSLTSRAPVRVGHHVVTIHDLFPLTNPEWYSRQYAALHRRLLRHHLKHASAIVVVSEPVRDAVAQLARSGMPISVAPNAPSRVLVGSRDDIGPSAPERFFLAVGSLDPRKNLTRLVEAYGRLPATLRADVPLLIVGGGADVFATSNASDRPMPAGVRFLGRVSDAELARLYQRATAFVSTSLDEGFGLPLVEAAQSMNGVMVVSDIPVYRWVMGVAPAVYVDPVSTDSIAHGLATSLDVSPDTAALRHLTERFSWDRSAQTIADLATEVSAS